MVQHRRADTTHENRPTQSRHERLNQLTNIRDRPYMHADSHVAMAVTTKPKTTVQTTKYIKPTKSVKLAL